jgi:hypothetical protein
VTVSEVCIISFRSCQSRARRAPRQAAGQKKKNAPETVVLGASMVMPSCLRPSKQ